MPTLPTPQLPQSDLQLEIAHLLLIDIVGYSKLLVNEQIEAVQELGRIVRNTECFGNAEEKGKLIRVPRLANADGRLNAATHRDQRETGPAFC